MDSRFVLGVLLLCACKAQLADGVPDGGTAGADGSGLSDPDAGNDPMGLGPWGVPAKVPGADSNLDEDDGTLSASRLELYFKRNDRGDANLYVMTRATPTSAWSAPVALGVLNTLDDEESPRLAPDDLTLYFGREGNIFRTTRAAAGSPWGAPAAVATLNTTAYEKWAAVCANGYVIVSRFVATRGQDLFEGTLATGAPTPLAQLNTTATEQGTFLSSDCLRVYFQSDRVNGQFDIYLATRTATNVPWSAPAPITDFNTATFDEEDAWTSSDQRTFVFASDSSGNKDVYLSTR